MEGELRSDSCLLNGRDVCPAPSLPGSGSCMPAPNSPQPGSQEPPEREELSAGRRGLSPVPRVCRGPQSVKVNVPLVEIGRLKRRTLSGPRVGGRSGRNLAIRAAVCRTTRLGTFRTASYFRSLERPAWPCHTFKRQTLVEIEHLMDFFPRDLC